MGGKNNIFFYQLKNLILKYFTPTYFCEIFYIHFAAEINSYFSVYLRRCLYGKIEEKWGVTNGWSTWSQSNPTCRNGKKSYSILKIFQLWHSIKSFPLHLLQLRRSISKSFGLVRINSLLFLELYIPFTQNYSLLCSGLLHTN